ncbi:MAG: gliding motility-associated C-terminal domain-containing protein [Saprospiraceae bacterium]
MAITNRLAMLAFLNASRYLEATMISQITHRWLGLLIPILITGIFTGSTAQNLLRNGSFEGQDPFYSRIPLEWQVCDSVSTPDIQPISSDRPAYAGDTYVGLVARVRTEGRPEWNGTVEGIYQELTDFLIPGLEYKIRLFLMYDPNHKPSAPQPIGTAKMRIYVGNDPCAESRLIWQSVIISHERWQPYEIRFTAKCGDRFVRFQADIADESYDLNYIMLDSVSLFKTSNGNQALVDCSDPNNNGSNGNGTNQGNGNGSGYESGAAQCPVYCPNVFSPNGDGINDVFLVYPHCQILRFRMDIMDRWGNLVFSSRNENDGWDGTSAGRSPEAGVYSFRIWVEYLGPDGRNEQTYYRDALTLVR